MTGGDAEGRQAHEAFAALANEHRMDIAETHPAGRLGEAVQLLYGLAHDGKLPESGRPSFLQAIVIAEAMGDDTVLTSPCPRRSPGNSWPPSSHLSADVSDTGRDTPSSRTTRSGRRGWNSRLRPDPSPSVRLGESRHPF